MHKERIIQELEALTVPEQLEVYNLILLLKDLPKSASSKSADGQAYLRVRAALADYPHRLSDQVMIEREERL